MVRAHPAQSRTCRTSPSIFRDTLCFAKHSMSMHLVHPCRARLPSRSESHRCDNEAFVREAPQRLRVEDAKSKFSCETCRKFCKFEVGKTTRAADLPHRSSETHVSLQTNAFSASSSLSKRVSCQTSFNLCGRFDLFGQGHVCEACVCNPK